LYKCSVALDGERVKEETGLESISIIIYDNTMSSSQDLSSQLRSRRESLGLTLAQVARRAGTSVTALCRYEKGWARFEISTLRKLAASLSCRLKIELVPVPQPACPGFDRGIRRLRRLFWDRSLSADDLERHPRWVVGRIVEYGDIADVRFLAGVMGVKRFLQLTESVRFSSRRAERFWELIRTMEGIACTRKRSRPEAESFWIR